MYFADPIYPEMMFYLFYLSNKENLSLQAIKHLEPLEEIFREQIRRR
jgi:hypothetical protein